MYYQQTITVPVLRLELREKILALLVVASLLLQPLVGMLPPQAMPAPAGETDAQASLGSAPLAVDMAAPHTPPALAAPAAPAYPLPPELAGKPELAALRTMNSATFDMGDNRYAVFQDALPLHYQDAAGAWQRIDPRYTAIPGGWLNNTNTLRTALAEKSSQAKIAANTAGLDWSPAALELVTAGGESTPIATPRTGAAAGVVLAGGATVRYTDNWSMAGLQDQWQSGPGMAEYTMRLPALPQVPWWRHTPAALELRVQLALRPGVTLYVEGEPRNLTRHQSLVTNHPLVFTSASGEEIVLNPPTIYEQGRRSVATAGEYVLRATDDPQLVELRVRTPWDWLAAPERQFPVIIDPLFQMRSGTHIGGVRYDDETLEFVDGYAGERGILGHLSGFAHRMLVRFELPKLPAGSEIDKAYLSASPMDLWPVWFDQQVNWASSKVAVYALHQTTQPWWEDAINTIQPQYDAAAPLPPGEQEMFYSKGQEHPTQVLWDVSAVAKTWNRTALFDPYNPGLLLRAGMEQCPAEVIPGFTTPGCGAFVFEHMPDNWTNDELVATQYLSNQTTPFIDEDGPGSGLRLIVYYHGPQLVENEIVGDEFPGGLFTPPGNNEPYYGADHLYTIPVLPNNRWQAVVSRSFTETVGPDPATCQTPCNRRTPLHGLIPMKVQINDSESGAQLVDRLLQQVAPAHAEVGYILFNGRGAPTEYTDTPLQLRVTTGDNPVPVTGYDLRLISEQPAPLAAVTGASQDFFYTLDSAEPLVLWSLQMAPNTVNRIQIEVTGDGTRPMSYVSQYAGHLRAQIVRSNTQQDMSVSTGGAGTVKQWALAKEPTSSGMIIAEPGNYALAIANHGPQLTVYDEEECGKEFCDSTVVPVKYTLKIRVTSCAPGTFPTQDGACQKVECPNTQTFPAIAGHYQEVGGLRLWSKQWVHNPNNTGQTVAGDSAPLIGPPGSNSPTVAVLGGVISYAGPTTVQVDAKSTIMLIQCPAAYGADGAYQKWFDVYEGAMERQSLLGSSPYLRATDLALQRMIQMPWSANDQAELSQLNFTVDPDASGASKAYGTARLRRSLDDNGQARLFNFGASWSWTADGWPSLSSTVSEVDGNLQPPDMASLIVDLGDNFSLDTEPANGQDQRRFLAVRAHQASITQQPQLGGASRNLQAVILPRNIPIPEINRAIPNRSALDLRAPDDAPNLPAPRRNWDMPDVLTNIDANTVMMSAAGSLTVFSSDHPNVSAATVNEAFSKEFNFGAGKAKVSLDFAPCGGVGPDVFIVKGAADIAIPNVGGAVGATFMLCETTLRSVHMSFTSPVGIPLGQSGMFLVGLHGGVDIFPDYTRITVGLDFQAAPGGDGGLFKASGTVIIDTRGLFEFQGTAKILGTVDASGKIWVAWNPLDTGFEVNITVGDWLKGFARAHLWQGQGWQNRYTWLPDNDDMHFAGQIGATLIIPEGAIVDWEVLTLPPGDISISVEVSFGEFCVNSSCTVYEWGIKGKFVVAGYGVGVYYGFDEGLDFILGNDDHILIDQYGGNLVSVAGVQGSEQVPVQQAPAQVNGEVLLPFTVKASTEQILVAIGWQAGAPHLSLVNPDGVEINAANAAQHQAQVDGNATTSLITVQLPKPGAWQARISNLSAEGIEHYKFIYLANKGAPGAPGAHGHFLNPIAAAEEGTNSYLLRWVAPEDTPDTATISLYSYRTEVITGNLAMGVPIVKNLPFKTGQFQWDTSGLLNGLYRIRAEIDDGVNDLQSGQISIPEDACQPAASGLPHASAFDPNRFPGTVVITSTGTIAINDVTPPAAPTGLQLYPVDHAIMARWNASPEPDVNSYILRWGLRRPDALPQGFIIQNQALVAAEELPTYRIGAVTNGIQYGVDIAAVDVNGNTSPFAPASFAIPSPGGNVVPSTPVSLTLAARTSDSATFSWNAGPGAAPATYHVEYMKLGDKVLVLHQESAAASVTLGGLETGASYLVRVAAGNSDGWYSDYSQPVQVHVTNGVDSNGDGMADDWAAKFNVSDPNGDPDGDGLPNAAEYSQGSDPHKQDSDGDAFSDAEEQAAGTDPQDALRYGAAFTQPRLHLSDDRLTFKAKKQDGGGAAPQAVQWINTGGGALVLQTSTDQPWIMASVAGDAVQVNIDHSGLAPGFHSGVVRLSNAAGLPIIGDACIRVNAWVSTADNDVPGARQNQTIDFAPLADRVLGEPPFMLNATASSGLPVSFASNTPAVCTVNGVMLTLVSAGSCTIVASQAGDAVYNPAPNVMRSFAVNDPAKQNQTIDFAPLADRVLGDAPFALHATASSGLPVSFNTLTPGVCTLSGAMLSVVATGQCTVVASQTGDAVYNAAADVTRSFRVHAQAPAMSLYLPLVAR